MELSNAGKDVYTALNGLIREHHPDLLEISDQILVVFREKAPTPGGGQPIIGKTSKAPPLISSGLITANHSKYKFVITLGFDAWNMLTDRQKTAQLDHNLCAISVDVDKEDTIKYGLKQPDFVGYRAEVDRWGLWRPECEPEAPSLVEKMFGKPRHGDKTDDYDLD